MEKTEKTDTRERLVKIEVEMDNLQNGLDTVSKSVEGLHGKFDQFSMTITQSYVSRDTFEEYKKNRMLERVLTILITAIITGLVAFFLRENRI